MLGVEALGSEERRARTRPIKLTARARKMRRGLAVIDTKHTIEVEGLRNACARRMGYNAYAR